MSEIPSSIRASGHARQSGVALMVVLILLVMMTLLALVSLRGTLMQERMSSSQRDRSLAFQSAEAALREGESVAANKPAAPGSGCDAKAVCATPDPNDAPRWLDDANWGTVSKEASDADLGTLGVKARYIIEYMGEFAGKTCTTSGDVSETTCADRERIYRITARSSADGRADVTLQSNYAVP
jgi:type IV pilus assembly protein PilX